ncbi:MAG: hypothetical protein R6V83_09110 [Candidatus Thorarchaeota archaeon]
MPKRARCPYCGKLFDRYELDEHVRVCRRRNQHSESKTKSRRKLVIDGNNVAYYLSYDGVPQARNIALADRSLRNAGYNPVAVVSAALKYRVEDEGILDRLVRQGKVIEASSGTNDDMLILRLAKRRNADVVSNDRFLEWVDRFPWIARRRHGYRMTPSGLILL